MSSVEGSNQHGYYSYDRSDTDSVTLDEKNESIRQWVTSIVNVESKSDGNLKYLNNILGPVKTNVSQYAEFLEEPSEIQLEIPTQSQSASNQGGFFTHEIIFKIEEKVFIEAINIYEKVVADSSIIKIEALEIDNNKNEKWFKMWDTIEPLATITKAKIFSPKIRQTPFKTDTVKFTISGSLHLIDGIEIKGNKLAVDNTKNVETSSQQQYSAFKNYSLFAKQLYSLIKNDLFADVFFEVEGQIIPAHRNILVFRSEYFRAMVGSNGSFKESFELNTKNSNNENNPIYIKDITFDVFVQVLNFLYTGHIYDYRNIPYYLLIGIMRAADSMNLTQLEKLCLFHLSELINYENVIKIYKEASETPDVLKDVLDLCYDVIQAKFSVVSKSADFCSLDQTLMLRIIENVIPKLARVTSIQVEAESQTAGVLYDTSSDDESLTE